MIVVVVASYFGPNIQYFILNIILKIETEISFNSFLKYLFVFVAYRMYSQVLIAVWDCVICVAYRNIPLCRDS